MDPASLAKVFVKTVVRMFYETDHIVVVDALIYHSALTLPDLVLVLDQGKNQKGAAKLMGKLREGGLVSVFTRAEVRDGAMKAINRDWYYIDYRRAVDCTKYKLHILDTRIKKDAAPTQEKKELRCPQCKAQWTFVEVLDSIDVLGRESGFLCKTCSHPLKEIEHEGDVMDVDDAPAKFNKFFDPLVKLMAQIDEVTIPDITGEDAINNAVELPRDQSINPTAKHEVVVASSAKPTAVKGLAMAPEKIEVSIATSSEQTEAERAEAIARQAKIASQNQLPTWHTTSTVIGPGTMSGTSTTKADTNGVGTPVIKTELVENGKDEGAKLDDVFAQIEAERQAKAESSSEEEDDEDEFEDVPASTPNPQPDAKRVKLETPAAPSPANGATPATSTPGGDESEEDEFEDV